MIICTAADTSKWDPHVRHISLHGLETLCGKYAGPRVELALPVDCPECRAENGRRNRGIHQPPMPPTAITVAMNLRWHLYAACLYSLQNTYPRGEGTPPELAPLTDVQRRDHADSVAHYASQLHRLYPAVYERWQAACVAAQDAVDPTAFV